MNAESVGHKRFALNRRGTVAGLFALATITAAFLSQVSANAFGQVFGKKLENVVLGADQPILTATTAVPATVFASTDAPADGAPVPASDLEPLPPDYIKSSEVELGKDVTLIAPESSGKKMTAAVKKGDVTYVLSPTEDLYFFLVPGADGKPMLIQAFDKGRPPAWFGIGIEKDGLRLNGKPTRPYNHYYLKPGQFKRLKLD